MAPVSGATQRDSANEKAYYKMIVVLGTCYCKPQKIFVVQIYGMGEGREKREGKKQILICHQGGKKPWELSLEML